MPKKQPSRLTAAGSVVALVAATGMISAYQDNQNTYLLHAVAARGGPLVADRLARTPDPTPVFTSIARGAMAIAGEPWGLYVLWVAAAAAFFAALLWAAAPLLGTRRAVVGWTAIVAVLAGPLVGDVLSSLTSAHVAGLKASGSLLGGVAEQYALGQYLQPSAAGVLLVLATVAAVRHRDQPLWIATLFVAGIIHPTYLVTAWVLAGGLAFAWMLEASGWRNRARVVVQVGVIGLIASVPGIVLNRAPLWAARGRGAARANEILADRRLPHHANPGRWFEPATLVLLVVVVTILVLARRHPNRAIRDLSAGLLGVAAVSAVLTIVAILANDPGLRLLFPWRASIVVVPLAFALGAGLLVERARGTREVVAMAAAVVTVALVAAGVARTANDLRHPVTDGALIQTIRANPPSGEGVVPVDEEDLRLNVGYPIYVDFKSHPFEPAAVLSWWGRVGDARRAELNAAALCDVVDGHHEGWVVARPPIAEQAQRTCLEGWKPLAAGPYTYLRRP